MKKKKHARKTEVVSTLIEHRVEVQKVMIFTEENVLFIFGNSAPVPVLLRPCGLCYTSLTGAAF